ncbi:hypothetical protein [Planococcus salinarum]|uniref:hypothetical protein n=1 Tax=Planococcus salinarum TaxID=622695 RepID=UPI000E3ECB5E|nr:hypothetical protein [Planococcus salinarum]TAA72449.1 hypothetical protein D2909_06755 [Planococcus salinarum]
MDKQLQEFLETDVKAFNVKGSGGAYLSMVKAGSGTSIRLSKEATKKLKNPTQLSIGFKDAYLVICNASGLDVDAYKGNFKDGQTKIYNTNLVDAVIKEFNLDFSGKTSISFGTGYYKQQGRTVLYVKLA